MKMPMVTISSNTYELRQILAMKFELKAKGGSEPVSTENPKIDWPES
jgi:hypothetical protein